MKGISRRKNPSQIAIVNEVIKKSRRNKNQGQKLIEKGEEAVLKYLKENGQMTLKELGEKTGRTSSSVRRLVSNLVNEGSIERVGNGRNGYWAIKNKDEYEK